MRGLVLMVGLMACGVTAPDMDDADAEMAGAQPMAAEPSKFTGLYAVTATAATRREGDLVALELTPTAAYVRARCYHDGCGLVVPETDRFDHYTSTGGIEYLRFWSFDVSRDAGGGLEQTPEVVDAYEVHATAKGFRLRKSHTTRWIEMTTQTPDAACSTAGGKWDGGMCSCASGLIFVSGAGGCVPEPAANEARCDASDGLWTDDDATLIGSYCLCGQGRLIDNDGSCTTI